MPMTTESEKSKGKGDASPGNQMSDLGILVEGQRNDGLTRLGGALRRKGATQTQIETELLRANARRCRPPLSETEVSKISASVSAYPVGGPDPLERAWQAIQHSVKSNYDRFLELAQELQLARPGQAVALPLERIASLMDVDWTMVRRYRREAVASGRLIPAENYIAHRRCATFQVLLSSPTKPTKPINGLVGQLPGGTTLGVERIIAF